MAKNTDVIDFQSLVASFSLCGEKLETKFDNINDIEYIVGTQTAATGSWTGKTKSTALYTGKTIIYKLPYASSGNVSLNLTFPDGSKSGAKAVYRYASTRLTTQYGANYYVPLVFNGTYWFAFADYDTNSYDRIRIPNPIAIADGAIKASCLVGTLDGTYYKELQNGSTFDLRYPYFYNSSSINDGANISTSLYIISGDLNLRTFFNDDNKTVTFPKLLYLKGTLAGNVFTIHSDIIVEEPTTPDDYLYIQIGSSYSAYKMYLNLFDQRIYKWVNGVFQAFDNKALRAVEDYQGQQIDSTYIKNITTTNNNLIITKGDNNTNSVELPISSGVTLDTVPATVDGGIWYEIESNNTCILKLLSGNIIYNFITTTQDPQLTVTPSPALPLQLVNLDNGTQEMRLVMTESSATFNVSYLGTGTIRCSVDNTEPNISYDSSTHILTFYNGTLRYDTDCTITITLSAAEPYRSAKNIFNVFVDNDSTSEIPQPPGPAEEEEEEEEDRGIEIYKADSLIDSVSLERVDIISVSNASQLSTEDREYFLGANEDMHAIEDGVVKQFYWISFVYSEDTFDYIKYPFTCSGWTSSDQVVVLYNDDVAEVIYDGGDKFSVYLNVSSDENTVAGTFAIIIQD